MWPACLFAPLQTPIIPVIFCAETMIHLFIYFLLSFSIRNAEPPNINPLSIGSDTCRTGRDSLTGRQIYLDADTGPECEGGAAAWLRRNHASYSSDWNRLPDRVECRSVVKSLSLGGGLPNEKTSKASRRFFRRKWTSAFVGTANGFRGKNGDRQVTVYRFERILVTRALFGK